MSVCVCVCVCVCVWRVTLVCGIPSRAWRERGNLETLIPRVYNKVASYPGVRRGGEREHLVHTVCACA